MSKLSRGLSRFFSLKHSHSIDKRYTSELGLPSTSNLSPVLTKTQRSKSHNAYDIEDDEEYVCITKDYRMQELEDKYRTLVTLQRKLIFPPNMEVSIVSNKRDVLFQGDVTKVEKGSGIFSKRTQIHLHVILFTDMLIICKAGKFALPVVDVAFVQQSDIYLREMTSDNEIQFLKNWPFLSSSHVKKSPISIVFFRTKLGEQSSENRRHSGFKEASPNSFQDINNVFVFQSFQEKDLFLEKLSLVWQEFQPEPELVGVIPLAATNHH